jgi:hypothetical protein
VAARLRLVPQEPGRSVPLRAGRAGGQDSGKQLDAKRERDERYGDGGRAKHAHDRGHDVSPVAIVSPSAEARQRPSVMARRSATHTITTIISMRAS